jgi:hypothetical protein
MHLADLKSYLEEDQRLLELYADPDGWARKANLNVAGSGKFFHSARGNLARRWAEGWGDLARWAGFDSCTGRASFPSCDRTWKCHSHGLRL